MKQIDQLVRILAAQCNILLSQSRCMSGKVQVKVFHAGKFNNELVKPKVGKTIAVDTLVKLLNIRRYTALDLVSKARRLCYVPSEALTSNYKALIEENIKNAQLIKHPEMLACKNLQDLNTNIEIIKKLPYNLNDTIYLSVLEPGTVRKLVEKGDFLDRIDLFIRKLDTSVDVIVEGFVKRPFLLSTSLKRLDQVITLLKDNKVTCADITKDWWILQYTPKLIQERIDLSRDNNIDPIKTWMVRCTLDILDRYIQRRSDNKLVLGDNTLVEYLSARLQCTSEEAKGLVSKQPALVKKSMKKMKEIIDFLYGEGFKPYHICRVPKILLHSVQTTKKRIRELERQGVRMDSLHILTKSQTQYMQYYQALVKSNSAKLTQ